MHEVFIVSLTIKRGSKHLIEIPLALIIDFGYANMMKTILGFLHDLSKVSFSHLVLRWLLLEIPFFPMRYNRVWKDLDNVIQPRRIKQGCLVWMKTLGSLHETSTIGVLFDISPREIA